MTLKIFQWLAAALLLAAATAALATSAAEYAHPDSYTPEYYDKTGYQRRNEQKYYPSSDYGYGGDKGVHCGSNHCTCPPPATGCPLGLTQCDGQCVNTISNTDYCRPKDAPAGFDICGVRCEGGQICVLGLCQCPTGQELCGDVCLLGGCPPDCPTNSTCIPSTATAPDNPASCGLRNGTTCEVCTGFRPTCQNGVCAPCVRNGESNGLDSPPCRNNQECCSCDCKIKQGQSTGFCVKSPKVGGGCNCPNTCSSP